MPRLNIKDWTLYAIATLGICAVIFGGVAFGSVINQIALALLLMIGVGTIKIYVKTKKWVISSADAISAILIAEVLAPSSSFTVVTLVCACALVAKHLIVIKNRNLFNPAAFGLTFGLLFGAQIGWWAAFNPFLTIVVGAALLIEFRSRWKLILTFLISLALLIACKALITQTSMVDDLYLLLGSSFFFTFFMLTDPKTSPVRPYGLIAFGMIVALVTALSSAFLPSLNFLGGLLIANACVPMLNSPTFARLSARIQMPKRVA